MSISIDRIDDSTGGDPNGAARALTNEAVSQDGRYVVFTSTASDMGPGADPHSGADVFIYDRQTGTTVARLGGTNGDSVDAAVSGDGRFVAFESSATDVVAGDTNGRTDIFVHDRTTGTTIRLGGNGNSGNPSLSADGRFIAFDSTATDLVTGDTNGRSDIFVYDRSTGNIALIPPPSEFAGEMTNPSISGDGLGLAFEFRDAQATPVVLFLRRDEPSTGAITPADSPDMSADGGFVAFRFTGSGEIGLIDLDAGFFAIDSGSSPSISDNGNFLAYSSTSGGGAEDVFVLDRTTGVLRRLSDDTGPSTNPAISGDGTVVAFLSASPSLVGPDGNGVPDVFVVNLQALNRAPSGTDSSRNVAEGADVTFSAADFGFSDPQNSPPDAFRSVVITSLPSPNGLRLSNSIVSVGQEIPVSELGNLTYTPLTLGVGTVQVTTIGFQVRDNGGTANGGQDTDPTANTLTFNITLANRPPVAVDDTGTTAEGTVLDVPAAQGVLVNDTDANGDVLRVARFVFGDRTAFPGETLTVDGVGAVTIREDGSYRFEPDASFNGEVRVLYDITDGGQQFDPRATLTLTVTPVNDPPTAVDDTGTTLEDTVLTRTAAQGLLANDTDPDNDTLTVVAYRVTGSPTAVAAGAPLPLDGGRGTLTINADGSYTFTPGLNYAGPLPTFSYTIRDAADVESTATLTLSITPVNDAPNAVADSGSTSENTPVTIAVLANDTDIENNPLTAAVATAPGNGTATVLPDGRIQYTPNAGFVGTDTFTYRANDGTDNSAPATVTVAVSTRGAINGTPLADTLTGTEGRDSLNGLAGNDVINALGGDDTVDGGPGADQMRGGSGNDTYIVDDFSDQVIEAPGEGTDTIRTGLAAYTMPTGSEVENLVYTGSSGFTGNGNQLANAITGGNADDSLNGLGGNDTLNGLNGNDSLSGMDGQDRLVGGLGNDTLQGGLDSDTFVFDTPLNATNNVDRVADLTSGVDKIELSGIVFTGLPTGPLAAGAFDRVGDATAATAATRIIYDPGQGTLSFDPDGTGAQAAVLFARVNPFQALVASDFVVTNGANAPVNTAPVANNDTGSGVQGNPITGNVLGNDTDAENNPLTATLQAGASNGTVLLNADGSYTYTPNASFTGTDSFSYRASDGTASSNVATVSLTVNPPGLIAGGPGNDTLNGTPGPDTIDGGAGIDTMRGFAGDDVYLVDSPADQVIEAAGQGTDTIRTALAQFTLATTPEVENLTYTGVQGFNGQGNGGNNVITGGVGIDVLDGAGGNDTLLGLQGNDTLLGQAGTDRLAGGIGNDTLAGGTEADTFVFDTALNATTNVDRITDFTPGADKLELDDAVFAGLAPGALNANAFDRLGDATAATAATRIIYDPATGNLFFDADGNGAQAAVQFATLNANLNLQASDVNIA